MENEINKHIVQPTTSSDYTLYSDICTIIEHERQQAYTAINQSMIETYWHIGSRIVEEEQNGEHRAEYGERIIENLSKQLTLRYSKGFSKRYLAYFRKFYLTINDIQILQTCLQNLTWSHIFKALRAEDTPTSVGILKRHRKRCGACGRSTGTSRPNTTRGTTPSPPCLRKNKSRTSSNC